MIVLRSFHEAREGFRSKALRQSLYDDGAALMEPVIVNLHGQAHTERRRLENRLFSPQTIAFFEHERIPKIIETVLAGLAGDGTIDLLPLARRVMLWLSLDVAGVDLPVDDREAAFERLFDLMHRLARASTVVHATGDKAAIVADGNAALAAFENEFYRSALARRMALIEAGDDLPSDILTTLLVNEDRLALPPEDVLREVAYFPWVGAHSTAAQFVHAMHHVFEWLDVHPTDRSRLSDDLTWRLRFVHESMRLHPASPVAQRIAVEDTTVADVRIPKGSPVVIDVEAANRDPSVFGHDPEAFHPDRTVAEGVARWGLSFGSGMHACLGKALAAGQSDGAPEPDAVGAVALLMHVLLGQNARPDPDDPPMQDPTTTRTNWGRYPVLRG